jgi:hypothetical protein
MGKEGEVVMGEFEQTAVMQDCGCGGDGGCGCGCDGSCGCGDASASTSSQQRIIELEQVERTIGIQPAESRVG